LHALETARCRVEARYLGGASALFPADKRAWAEQRRLSEAMAVTAMRPAELEGHDLPPADDPASVEDRVAKPVADHVEPARVTAYNELGDGHRAGAVATRWLRLKFAKPSGARCTRLCVSRRLAGRSRRARPRRWQRGGKGLAHRSPVDVVAAGEGAHGQPFLPLVMPNTLEQLHPRQLPLPNAAA